MSFNAAYNATQEDYEEVDVTAIYESMEEHEAMVRANTGSSDSEDCQLQQSTHRSTVTTHTEHSQILSGEYI